MKLTLASIRDTTEGAVSYLHRLIAGSSAAKDAILYGLPGIYCRPMDDSTTTGTEDVIALEDGEERSVIASRNSTGWQRILDYLGRAFDKGETVITAEDGTARCYVSTRPNGDVIISADSGGANDCTITWDASTGNVDIVTSGTVRVGGATVTDSAAMYQALKTEYDAHIHTCPPPIGSTSVPTVLLTPAVKSTKLEVK